MDSVFTTGAMRHWAAAYVNRCVLHQQENLTLWLLAALQATHLIGTGSSANYNPKHFLEARGPDGYTPEMERILEGFQRVAER